MIKDIRLKIKRYLRPLYLLCVILNGPADIKLIGKRLFTSFFMFSVALQGFPVTTVFAQTPATIAAEAGPTPIPTNVDPYANLTTQDRSILNSLVPGQESSPTLRQVSRLRPFVKKVLKGDEPATVVVDNASFSNLTIKVFDFDGYEVSAETEVISETDPVVIKLHPGVQTKPGRYRVKVSQGGATIGTQEFDWGVLAINTNKSVYSPGETASIQMAVLDDIGDMVCNSDMTLQIRDPKGSIRSLTTVSGEIIVNPQCYTKDLTLVPDYQASYVVGEAGIYGLTLTATQPDGSYTINDSFEVSNSPRIDVERKTATRIYPPHTYPVTFEITANEDFSGIVRETVPGSFSVLKSNEEGVISFETVEEKTGRAKDTIYPAEMFSLGLPYKGDYRLTQGFGRQHRDPDLDTKYTQFGVLGHDGADFALPINTAVTAADDGKIVRAKGNSDYGTTIVIQHAWGKSYYGHLNKIIKTEGTEVKKGEIIALSGNTGLSSGPHLHFGVKPEVNDLENGFYGKINPLPFLGLSDNGITTGQVAGISTTQQSELGEGTKVLSWKLSLKKGEKIRLGYQFQAPLISPELYLLGPLQFSQRGVPFFTEKRHWQIAADSVVVNGGIVSSEAQFGGLQRKVAYVNSNWYAFYNDGTDVFWKKSSDGITWGSANNLDVNEDNDADNYNPSIDVSSNRYIHVAYLDESADQVQMLTLDTNTDTTPQTSVCALASPGAFTVSTYMVSVASLADATAVVAYSDTNGGSNVDIFEVASLTSTSCTSTDVHPGNIQFGTQGSGLTASDRPVLVGLDSTTAVMVFQNGSDLKSARYDASRDEWRRNNQTIASVTDTTYSVVTDGTNVWVLTQNGTTGTRLYHGPVASTGIIETSTPLDSDVGAAGDEQDTELDMWCPPSDAANCKIIYVDDLNGNNPDVTFIDCNSEDCSSNTQTDIDTNTGSASNAPSPALFCVATDNCKLVYGDVLGGTSPDVVFFDCNSEDCSTSAGSTILNSDIGGSTSKPNPSIYCLSDTDCKVVYFEDDTDDLWFVDCSDAVCANTQVAIALNINTTNSSARNSIWCPSGDTNDCKVVYHSADAGTLLMRDCNGGTATCGTADSTGTIDSAVGTTGVTVPNGVDCVGGVTDCKVLYADGNTNDVFFVDCGSADCSSGSATITKIDDTAGGLNTFGVDLFCISATDCKGVFVGNTAGGSEDQYFFDCDNADCSSGSVIDLSDPPTRAALSCPSSTNCKLVYYDAVEGGQPPLYFADLTNEDGLPDWQSLTAPWTSETNVTSVSLTYDSTNTDLIANIIKDSSEQAYYSIADNVTSPSWATAVAYDFTAGDLDNISSPETAAGRAQMGVLLRQAANIEFDLLAGLGPTLEQAMRHGKWFSGGAEQPFTF